MKKKVIVFSALFVAISLTTYGFVAWKTSDGNLQQCHSPETLDQAANEQTINFQFGYDLNKRRFNFIYKVEHRFTNTVSEEKLKQATSVLDIIPGLSDENIESFENIQVSTYHFDQCAPVAAAGNNEIFNSAQLQVLKSMDCTSNFYVTGRLWKKNNQGELYKDTLVYYMTVVPHQNATYSGGLTALEKYLKENSKAETSVVEKDKLDPGKISFIITKNGSIDRVKLNATCGYESVDKKMLALVNDLPGKWTPATNAEGENIDQELTFFFGEIGC